MPEALQAAFVLHRRNYKDTSQIIEFFTLHYGRISAVAKGAKRPKSPLKSSLHLFQPLLINWQGKQELATLTHAELQKPFTIIQGKLLAWGFYLNELLYRLLDKHEAYPAIFQHYHAMIHHLSVREITETQLRLFEAELLSELGYGLHLTHDEAGLPLAAQHYYLLEPGHNPSKTQFTEGKHVYLGQSLLDLAAQNLESNQSLQDAKRLLRQSLQPLLDNKPFKSRELLL
jgi:DNA repair protein RecO (recombination protein O)